MRNKLMQFFLLLGLMAGVAGMTRAAAPYQLNVPFDFTVNGKLMKAGSYSVSFGISSANSGSFLIRSADGKNAAIVTRVVAGQPSVRIEDISVIFEKNGNDYSLSKINSPRVSIELLGKDKISSAKADRVELKAAQ